MATYHHLPYNILRKSKRDECPVVPAGHTHLGRDTVALPARRKKDTPAWCLGQVSKVPCGSGRGRGHTPLWAETHSPPRPALPGTDATWAVKPPQGT